MDKNHGIRRLGHACCQAVGLTEATVQRFECAHIKSPRPEREVSPNFFHCAKPAE
jgi:hypothetical protein